MVIYFYCKMKVARFYIILNMSSVLRVTPYKKATPAALDCHQSSWVSSPFIHHYKEGKEQKNNNTYFRGVKLTL